jgi:hypothetical protein
MSLKEREIKDAQDAITHLEKLKIKATHLYNKEMALLDDYLKRYNHTLKELNKVTP